MKDKNIQIQLDEVEKKIKIRNQNLNSSANKNFEEINQKFSLLQNSFNAVNIELETLKQKLDLIEESVGGGQTGGGNTGGNTGGENNGNLSKVALTGNYYDLLSRPDTNQEMRTSSDQEFNYLHELYIGETLTSPNLYFTCSPEETVQGVMRIFCSTEGYNFDCNEIFELWANDEVKLGEITFTSLYPLVTSADIAFKFRPKKAFNFFKIVIVASPLNLRFKIENMIVNFEKGKNIFVVNRQNTKKIAEYKGKYVLYANSTGVCQAKICDKDTFSGPLDITHSIKYFEGKPNLGFAPSYTKPNTVLVDTTAIAILGSKFNFSMNTPTPIYENVKTMYNYDYKYAVFGATMTYFREEFSSYVNVPGIVGVSSESGRLVYIQQRHKSLESFTIYFEYKVDDEFVESGCWVENVAVTAQDLTNINPLGFKGSVGVKNNGECVFFPHFNSAYSLPLGRGRNVHALIQENEDIHVYMGQIGFVIKKVLRKNSQGVYQIFSEKRIYGFDECIETTDGKILGITDDEFLLEDVIN